MNLDKKNIKFNKNKGFTLIELMVSLMIFNVVVLASVGSLYSVNNSSKKIQSMRSVVDNLNFAIESLSRNVKTGDSIVCGGVSNVGGYTDCPLSSQNPSDILLIHSTLGVDQLVEYSKGVHSNGNGSIQKRVQINGIWGENIALTAPSINVQGLYFYVEGSDPNDQIQPGVYLFVSGVASTSSEISPFAIQTYLSQRAAE